jgi:HAMP domain-containing protein
MHESPDNNQPAQSAERSADRIDDIEQLRERLAFYESFDQLIHDNVTRASDLLKEAASRKSQGELALRNTTAEFEKQQLSERINYRRIFALLLDEVSTVQQNVERLARQVSDALDDLEAVIPAAGEPGNIEGDQYPSMPTFSAGSAGELGTGRETPTAQTEVSVESNRDADLAPTAEVQTGSGADDEPNEYLTSGVRTDAEQSLEPVDELVTPDEAQYDPTLLPDAGSVAPGVGARVTFPEVVQASVDRVSQSIGGSDTGAGSDFLAQEPIEQEVADRAFESLPEDGFSVDLDQEPADSLVSVAPEQPEVTVQDEIESDWVDEANRAATTLLVHGVPRATTALSLKRYLEGLAQVHSVEPREYAEGILRLQVSSDRPVGLDDLRGWPEAASLEPVSVSDEFVEVRLNQ